MNEFITNFHFIRPLWFIALIPLIIVLWTLKRTLLNRSPWQKFIPAHLQAALLHSDNDNNQTKNVKKSSRLNKLNAYISVVKPFLIGLLTIIALAGPAWEKLPQPVYQTQRGAVVIMDMDVGMYANDLKPNRLTRARFKAIDLLKKINEGEVGLIASTSDAFIISPLTQDIKNIELLLPALSPDIMPVGGKNPLAALTLANEMLLNAGYLSGDIYWFIDDVDNSDLADIYKWSNDHDHKLNLFGVGTTSGAPIKLPSGELLKDRNGAIVIPKLPIQRLKSIAQRTSGNYHPLTHDDTDIEALVKSPLNLEDSLTNSLRDENNGNDNNQEESLQMGDKYKEQGAWIVFLILPLLLSYFRRGNPLIEGQNTTPLMVSFLFVPLILMSSMTFPNSVFANNLDKQTTSKVISAQPETASAWKDNWNSLWKTNDQQGKANFQQEQYQEAANQFDNNQWQGSAHFRAGNYQDALESFKKGEQSNSADSLYNQGNALAKLKK